MSVAFRNLQNEMRTVFKIIVIVLITMGVQGIVFSQTEPGVTAEMRAAANKSFKESNWDIAAQQYKKIAELEPDNPNANYRLGISLLNQKKYLEAQSPLEKAFRISPNPINGLATTRVLVRNNEKSKALEVLEKSATVGGIDPEVLIKDLDFAGWKSDPKFIEAVHKNDLARNPCKATPELREFDFWIGDWDVRSAQGQPAGSSSIQLILGHCVILENWTGVGSNGKSFNFFDKRDNKWHQTWVDDRGTFTHYTGGIQNGKMVIIADTIVEGKAALARITFSKLANGEIGQLGENSIDNGKTWSIIPGFNLIYSRRK